MKITKINQIGSHVVGVALLLCVLTVVLFAGVKVLGGHKVAVNTKTEAETVKARANHPTIPVPAAWKLFADADIGAQFVYPATAGVFTKPAKNDARFESSLVSGTVAPNYLPGVVGAFTFGSYKSSSAEIISRTFGPKVRLSGSEWIVTVPNQYDSTPYTKGDVYTEMAHTNTSGIDVYTATSGSEGVTQYNLYFVTKNKLRELELPPFNSDLDSSTYNVNDRTPYDTVMAQIRDSISLY